MNQSWVMTVLGEDRPGIVEALSDLLRKHDGSWQQSRLEHLQNQFAGIVEFSLPVSESEGFKASLKQVENQLGLHCHFAVVAATDPCKETVTLECIGQDRPGIVLAISDVFHKFGMNVESMRSSLQNAPMSGEILFFSTFEVKLPAQVDFDRLEANLATISEELLLDIQFEN